MSTLLNFALPAFLILVSISATGSLIAIVVFSCMILLYYPDSIHIRSNLPSDILIRIVSPAVLPAGFNDTRKPAL
jgi:hypothetical protein